MTCKYLFKSSKIKCDGEYHIWTDKNDYDWIRRCPGKKIEDLQKKSDKQCGNKIKSFSNLVGMEKEIEEIKKFPKNQKYQKLMLLGPVGTGKTHLAEAIFRESMQNGIACEFTTIEKLADLFRDEAMRDVEALQKLGYIRRSSLLVIDDLGRERFVPSQLFTEKFTSLLDLFAQNEGKKIIFTSNIPIEKMVYDDRIKSRLYENLQTITILGKDNRRVQ